MTDLDLYRFRLMRGVYSRVATKLGLGRSGRAHVSRVARAERQSPRVEAALRAEYKRITRLVEKRKAVMQVSEQQMGRAA